MTRPGPARPRRTGPTLDLDRYVPFFLTAISNKLSRGASRLYLREFGVGIIEWRIMSMLAVEPAITANRVCQVIGLDKAAASRSIRILEKRGYLSIEPDSQDGRRRTLELTEAGYALHDRIFAVALERERRLLAPFSPGEVAQVIDLLRRMHAQIPLVNDYKPVEPAGGGRRRARSRADRAADGREPV